MARGSKDTPASLPCPLALTAPQASRSSFQTVIPFLPRARPLPVFYLRSQTSQLGVLCRALDPGQPPGQPACDSAHTDDVYGRTIPQTLGSGSRGNPGWQMPAGCFHWHSLGVSSTPTTAQFGGWWGLPNKRVSLLFISQHIPDPLCLLTDNRGRRCFHFTGRGSLLPICGGGGVPDCSAHLGGHLFPGEGGEGGDLAFLPHDPSTPSCQNLLSIVPVSLGASSPSHPMPQPRALQLKGSPLHQDHNPELRVQLASALQGKFYLRGRWGQEAGVLRERGCSQESELGLRRRDFCGDQHPGQLPSTPSLAFFSASTPMV